MSLLNVLATSWMTRSKFHTKGPQILEAIIQSLLATANGSPAFVRFQITVDYVRNSDYRPVKDILLAFRSVRLLARCR
jgi:hypothetical protein